MQAIQLILNGLKDRLNLESYCISAGERREENTTSWKAPIKCNRSHAELSSSNRVLYPCYRIGRFRSPMKGYYPFPYNHITLLQNQSPTQHNRSFLPWGIRGKSWVVSQIRTPQVWITSEMWKGCFFCMGRKCKYNFLNIALLLKFWDKQARVTRMTVSQWDFQY